MSYVIKAVLSNANHLEYGRVTVPFPVPNEEYDRMIGLLEPLGIGDALRPDCQVEELDSFYTILNHLTGTSVTFDELDYLAKRLDSFDDGEAAQFQGMAHICTHTVAHDMPVILVFIKNNIHTNIHIGRTDINVVWGRTYSFIKYVHCFFVLKAAGGIWSNHLNPIGLDESASLLIVRSGNTEPQSGKEAASIGCKNIFND